MADTAVRARPATAPGRRAPRPLPADGASSAARVADSPELGRFIDVAGIRTNVHVVGDPSRQPTVLLLHGSGPGVSAYSTWRLTMPALSQGFAVVAPDIVGFGFTERSPTAAYDLPNWTSHVLGVIDALDIERADVLGHSFGGSLALSLAIRRPERVGRLGLVGSVGAPTALTDGLDAVWGYQPSLSAMEDLLPVFTYDASLIGPDLARLRYEASIRPGAQEAFARMFPAPRQRALDALTHPVDDIAAIAHPTLIVHGREDRVIPMSSSLTLFSLIPHGELHVFGECGHLTHIERAEAVNALVRDFLAR